MSIGTISLSVMVANGARVIEFVVVDGPSIYNAILENLWIHLIKVSLFNLSPILIDFFFKGVTNIKRRSKDFKNPVIWRVTNCQLNPKG